VAIRIHVTQRPLPDAFCYNTSDIYFAHSLSVEGVYSPGCSRQVSRFRRNWKIVSEGSGGIDDPADREDSIRWMGKRFQIHTRKQN